MRALTTATGIPRRKQPLSRLGQNSVSARISMLGLQRVQVVAHGPRQVERAIEDPVCSEIAPAPAPGRCGWWWR